MSEDTAAVFADPNHLLAKAADTVSCLDIFLGAAYPFQAHSPAGNPWCSGFDPIKPPHHPVLA